MLQKKKIVWASLIMLVVVSTVALAAYADKNDLNPNGRVRVALRSIGGGSATWYPTAPRVLDGSFSVRLFTGSSVNQDGGAIFIGPLGIPLHDLTPCMGYCKQPISQHTHTGSVTFWAYHYNDAGAHPYINLVLENGRIMEGIGSTPVASGAVVKSETGQGYPSADIWIKMMPTDKFYTSYGSVDPVLATVSSCTISSPCPMATWQAAFPGAKVVQIQIIYGIWGSTGQVIFIDSVTIGDMRIDMEPETIAAT